MKYIKYTQTINTPDTTLGENTHTHTRKNEKQQTKHVKNTQYMQHMLGKKRKKEKKRRLRRQTQGIPGSPGEPRGKTDSKSDMNHNQRRPFDAKLCRIDSPMNFPKFQPIHKAKL